MTASSGKPKYSVEMTNRIGGCRDELLERKNEHKEFLVHWAVSQLKDYSSTAWDEFKLRCSRLFGKKEAEHFIENTIKFAVKVAHAALAL
jgi:hypothetical protein